MTSGAIQPSNGFVSKLGTPNSKVFFPLSPLILSFGWYELHASDFQTDQHGYFSNGLSNLDHSMAI